MKNDCFLECRSVIFAFYIEFLRREEGSVHKDCAFPCFSSSYLEICKHDRFDLERWVLVKEYLQNWRFVSKYDLHFVNTMDFFSTDSFLCSAYFLRKIPCLCNIDYLAWYMWILLWIFRKYYTLLSYRYKLGMKNWTHEQLENVWLAQHSEKQFSAV